jgi:tRNA-2-methylthio-N6-dimethylallyladenosine synthase
MRETALDSQKTFHIFTFGCQMNAHDSGRLGRALTARGWREVPEDEAHVFILNTCSVREKPEQKVYSLVGRLAKHSGADKSKFVAVGGCVAQQVGQGFFERFASVRLVFGTDNLHLVPETLEEVLKEPAKRRALLDFHDEVLESGEEFQGIADLRPQEHKGSAYVNIMQGCDNFCSYCIVPFVRGRQKSRASAAILEECCRLVDTGIKEVVLLGQNVNSYGQDKHGDGTGFAELLSRVAEIEGIKRLRFTTSHPKAIDPEVVAAFGTYENLCPQLHLPLQSGSDRVLKAMGRKYEAAGYLDIVSRLKGARPDIALTTDLIVGFPGEDEEDFQRTLDMMRQVGYKGAFSFVYCDRPGTAASRMTGKVAEDVKKERLARLQALQEELTGEALAAEVGRYVEVLVEGPGQNRADENAPDIVWRGRDAFGRIVNFTRNSSWPARGSVESEEDLTGQMLGVRITVSKKHSLWGEAAGTL